MTVSELKQYIYEEDKIPLILEAVGCHSIKHHSVKDYYSCANPDGDNSGAVVVYNDEYLKCMNYTRDLEENADLLTLVSFYNGTKFKETLKYIHKILGLEFSYSQLNQKTERVDPLHIFKKVRSVTNKTNVLDLDAIGEDYYNDFVPYVHIDFFKDGVIGKTIRKFGLGYSFKYKRTIIPLRHWKTGQVLGTNARTSLPNFGELGISKYYITPSYPKSINLFGLYENFDSIQKAGYVVVYEGERSVLKRHSLCDETGVALSGHTMSDEQARILIGLDVDIIIAMDNDVGIDEVKHMCSKFKSIRNIYYIYDRYNLLPEKSSPADASNKQFQYLLKNKIKY